jgi:AmpD protein
MKIKKIPSPNFSSREGVLVDMIIIHCASLPEGEYGGGYITGLFLNRLDPDAHPSFAAIKALKVSAHFLIERGGRVIQYVDTDDKAWHAGSSSFCGRDDCNSYSIGIELEGDVHSSFTKDQYDALIMLCKILIAKYPLITKGRVVRHSDVAPGRKEDPGPFFDMESVIKEVFMGVSPKAI